MKDPVRVIDCRERAVVELWRKGHLSIGTIVIYLQWVRRFRTYCDKRKLQETEQLTAVGAHRFAKAYAGPRLKGATKFQGKPQPRQQCAPCVGLRVGGAGYAVAAVAR
jgi:hypothetical protein